MTIDTDNKRAPMASAPMKYRPDGQVDWGTMWETFCLSARDGGPPHRGTMLYAEQHSDPHSPAYQAVVAEIVRGIAAVSGLAARPAGPGWVAVDCTSAAMARWLAESIEMEHVQTRCEGRLLFVPAGASYGLTQEIKNVITVVAKSTHYWNEHLPTEVRHALLFQDRLGQSLQRIRHWLEEALRP